MIGADAPSGGPPGTPSIVAWLGGGETLGRLSEPFYAKVRAEAWAP